MLYYMYMRAQICPNSYPGIFVQDGDAHRAVFCVKGSAGTKFCPQCPNLMSVSSELADGAVITDNMLDDTVV